MRYGRTWRGRRHGRKQNGERWRDAAVAVSGLTSNNGKPVDPSIARSTVDLERRGFVAVVRSMTY